jgi:diguanylate cyclase (GGDEF)-like protein
VSAADLLAVTTTGAAVCAVSCAAGWVRAARLQRHLHSDRLTGLANRDALAARFRRVARRAPAVGLLLADLDGFKAINDMHGHDEGNIVLQHVAACMRTAATPAELVVRLHGDEFAVLLGAIPVGAAGRRLAALRRDAFTTAVATPLGAVGRDITVTATFGAAVLPGEAVTLSALLSAADRAMYTAKRARSGNDLLAVGGDRR